MGSSDDRMKPSAAVSRRIAARAAGGAGAIGHLPWKQAFTLAISAFIASLLLTGGQYLGKITHLAFWPDLLVRLAKTFIASLAGSMVAGVFDITTFDWGAALNVAVLATLAALGKGMLAREPAAPNGQVPPGASGTSSASAAHAIASARTAG